MTDPHDPIPYDDELLRVLEESALQDLRVNGVFWIIGIDEPDRYNAGVWFACKHGLGWELVCTVEGDPPAAMRIFIPS